MALSVETVSQQLAGLIKGDVFGDILHRAAFATDASIYSIMPVCVVAPRNVEDIVTVVNYARRNNIAVAARGAGSGVAGESLCSGIVLDMSRYMNRIIEVSEDGRTILCQPGVVLAELNESLADYGRKIGPDPSSANRAVVGGCVANNATGAHSLQYGYLGDYVEKIEAVLADGSIVEFGNDIAPAECEDNKVGELVNTILWLLSGKQDTIDKALPRTTRNRSGYNIADICHADRVDLARLMAGSEGTLCVFTKIQLRTVEVPANVGVLVLGFENHADMAKAVPVVVDCGAKACELMDRPLAKMAGEAYPQYSDILPTDAAVTLFVEHNGQSDDHIRDSIDATDKAVGDLAFRRRHIYDEDVIRKLSKARKDAVPLLNRRKGRAHPIPFIEDVSVENVRLAEYIESLQQIGKQYNVEMSYYGHAGDGELHVRPYIDLSDRSGVEKMLAIANDVFSVAWRLGGSISGEHADGLVRAAFIRRQYGDDFYNLLRQIKQIFDPDQIMNPGKILNEDPDVMTKNLRASKGFVAERLKSELRFATNELVDEIDQCSGCGVCLSREKELRMCPVYRALGEELGSSRAKANILRLWATGDIDEDVFEAKQFRQFLDLCVNCKACLLQCPSGVDISKMMIAARVQFVRRKGLRRTEMVLSNNRYLSIMGSVFSPLSNFMLKLGVFKYALDKIAGIDRRRDMPSFLRGSFLSKAGKWLAKQDPLTEPVDKVAYFVDSYANYNDHQIGWAVLKVLRANRIDIVLPRQKPAPLPAIVYGDVRRAKKDLEYSIRYLAQAVRAGCKIVCSEPSAALCLKDESRHYVGGPEAELVAANTYELMSYLNELADQGRLKKPDKQINGEFAYHCPCHLFAIGGGKASIEVLKKICGIEASDLAAGCCGLAGTFGMQSKNFDLSEEISKPLRNAIADNSVKNVLTECGACGMQIEHISDANAIHPIKLLYKAYDISNLD